MSNPEAETTPHPILPSQPSHDDSSSMSLLFSNVIIQARNEVEQMNGDQLKRLAFEAFQEMLNLSEEQLSDFPSMKDFININEPDEGDTLVMEDSNDSPSLMLVLNGSVELSQINTETNEPAKVELQLA